MKKLLAIILVLVMCVVIFAACDDTVEQQSGSNKSMFVEVEQTAYWRVVYHTETKIMYVISDGTNVIDVYGYFKDEETANLFMYKLAELVKAKPAEGE